MTDLATQGSDEVVTQPNDTPEPSMSETMAATLNSIRERDSGATTDQGNEAIKTDRTRGPDGKFVRGDEGAIKPIEPDGQAAQPIAEPVATNPAIPAQSAAPVNAPSSWTAEAKAEFSKASPVIQQEVLRREQQIHDGIAQYKEAANYGSTLYKAIQPFEKTIQQLGVTPEVAVSALLNADHKLRYGSPAEKMQHLVELAKGYGVDLSQGIPEQAAIDPNFAHLQRELQETKSQLSQFLSTQEQREQAELNSRLEQAKEGKPHFDELSRSIGLLLQAAIDQGKPITIDQAYQDALWASPTHRNELIAKQLAEQKAEEDKKRAEDAQKANAAKQAARVNVQKRGTLPAQKQVGTMKETMLETLDKIRAR